MNKAFDIVILGAGPAGTTCVLALKDSGLSLALIDKESFPRDKPCGDAIPGPCIKILKKVTENEQDLFNGLTKSADISNSHIYPAKGKKINIAWKAQAFNATRADFDNYLLNLVKSTTKTTVIEDFQVNNVAVEDKVIVTERSGTKVLTCDLLIAGDGTNSVVKRKMFSGTAHKGLNGYAIRSYYENVSCNANTNEFYLLDEFPGYFWIFPLTKNIYNVGVGLLNPTSEQAKSVNIKTSMQDVIENHPFISEKFKNASSIAKIQGFKLPLGGKDTSLTADHIMLTGDAAHLIDPLQGHGIDKAMESGVLAAKQAEICFKNKRFDSASMTIYQNAVETNIVKELRRNLWVMRFLFKFPFILRMAAWLAQHNPATVLGIFYRKRKNQVV